PTSCAGPAGTSGGRTSTPRGSRSPSALTRSSSSRRAAPGGRCASGSRRVAPHRTPQRSPPGERSRSIRRKPSGRSSPSSEPERESPMTRTQRWAAVLAASAVLASGAVGARAQQPPVTLAFATLDSGSAWYIYGATMAEVLRRALPPGSNVDVKPRAGGVGNPRLVAKNETPLGFGFTVTNRWAYEGKEAYDQKLDNLRALVGGLDTYYMVAVAAKALGLTS